jgi:O-antigen/teichoic acid export membrane protein
LILGINIVLIIILLPLLSIPGVALASLITQSLALCLQLTLCLKKQLVRQSLSLILSIFIFSSLTGLFIIFIKFFFPFTLSNLPIIIIIGSLLIGIASVSTGMINRNEWSHLYNETIS